MAKLKKPHKLDNGEDIQRNPVAKNAFKFNKAHVFRDQKHHYSRKAKHKPVEPFKIVCFSIILKGSINRFANPSMLSTVSLY